jgi:transcriptional regulator with XRE-family HTH domain
MGNCKTCGNKAKSQIIHEYHADLLGSPFVVILLDSVEEEVCESCGKNIKVTIPDPEGLLYMVSTARALHPRKLNGAEIKYLRKVLGWKGKDAANKLEMSVENFSRVENGAKLLSPQSEKLFRISIISEGLKQKDVAPDVAEKVSKLLNIKIESIWSSDDLPEFRFTHVHAESSPQDVDENGKWIEPHKNAA